MTEVTRAGTMLGTPRYMAFRDAGGERLLGGCAAPQRIRPHGSSNDGMHTLARAPDRAAIGARLQRLGTDSQRRWGRMTAHQAVRHLIDSFRMADGRLPARRAARLRERTLVKWLALYAPLRWPPGIETVPELDQLAAGPPAGEFAADVAELARELEAFSRLREDPARPPHPIFGRLSVRAWQRWGYLHMDHHLRQFGA